MTDSERQELQKLENIRKLSLYGDIFKGVFAVLTIMAFRIHIFAGILMVAAFKGMLEGTGTSISSNTDAQQRYYELRYLQILDNDD